MIVKKDTRKQASGASIWRAAGYLVVRLNNDNFIYCVLTERVCPPLMEPQRETYNCIPAVHTGSIHCVQSPRGALCNVYTATRNSCPQSEYNNTQQ